jgi:hypothetical protein
MTMLWKLTADTSPGTLAGILATTVMPGQRLPGINQTGRQALVAATTGYERPVWMQRLADELSERGVRHEVSWVGHRDDEDRRPLG